MRTFRCSRGSKMPSDPRRRRDVGRFGPEARLYAASVAGAGFAIGK
jgi:hypothetical protein